MSGKGEWQVFSCVGGGEGVGSGERDAERGEEESLNNKC